MHQQGEESMRDIVPMLCATAVLLGSFAGFAPLANAQAHRPEGGCPPGFDPNCVTGMPQLDIPAFQRKKLEDNIRKRQSEANPSAPPAPTPSVPNNDLSDRARLAEVQSSNAPPEEQARVACRHLFAATYRVRETDMTWTTVGPSAFRQEVIYLQVNGVGNTETLSASLSAADGLNKIQYKGSVTFRGSAYRTGFAKMGDTQVRWTPWKDLTANKGQFAVCYFEIKDGRAGITAANSVVVGEMILNEKFEKLSRPERIP
jgi:hypothetical protein